MAGDGKKATAEHVSDPASAVELAVQGQPFSYGTARSFVSDISVFVDLVDAAGNVVSGYPAVQGYNPVKVRQFDFLGGARIYGLF